MSSQIIFFRKNRLDLSFDSPSIVASQGNDFVNYLRNRSLRSGWITTGSVDADNTTIIADLGDATPVTDIILNVHNFKSYKIETWNAIAETWDAFATPINTTTNTDTTSVHHMVETIVSKIKITIRGTMVANDDKTLTDLIVTSRLGQLNGWPIIKKPTLSRGRKKSMMLSGKTSVREGIGSFSCSLSVAIWR
jgi:hypothetical protein